MQHTLYSVNLFFSRVHSDKFFSQSNISQSKLSLILNLLLSLSALQLEKQVIKTGLFSTFKEACFLEEFPTVEYNAKRSENALSYKL